MIQMIQSPLDLAPSHINVIKLLRTAKQLYEARAEASKILEMVTEIDFVLMPRQLVWRFLQDSREEKMPENRVKIFDNLFALVLKCYKAVLLFK